MKYEQISSASRAYGECNDCTVKATAIAFDLSYKIAHMLIEAFFNRKRGRGVHFRGPRLHLLAKAYGRCLKPVDLGAIIKRKGSGLTASTVPNWLPRRGIYLVFTRGHVFCYRGGKVHDWTEGRKHRVTEIYKVAKAS